MHNILEGKPEVRTGIEVPSRRVARKLSGLGRILPHSVNDNRKLCVSFRAFFGRSFAAKSNSLRSIHLIFVTECTITMQAVRPGY